MPATYTYNDAIEDAKREIMQAWEEIGGDLSTHMPLALKLIGRLDALKRPMRQKRRPVQYTPG